MDSPLPSPSFSPRLRARCFSCRRIDRLCWAALRYFPLLFVYSVAAWASYTLIISICYRHLGGIAGFIAGTLGTVTVVLQIWCYTFAVFTSPGSPLETKHSYSSLPTTEPAVHSSITIKSDGAERYCKKCATRKPDRTHHCSTCRRCVLKMDHHCPWLANCMGLYNYKAFLLFNIYATLFSLICFVTSTSFVYHVLFSSSRKKEENSYPKGDLGDDLTPVNWILLAVVSGIIGLVLGGFATWHLVLTGRNMTTIESMEKVRYTAPSLRRGAMPANAHLLNDPSDPRSQRAYEYNRYHTYLEEETSSKLPHAFNLGRRRNFLQVFGERWALWFVPMYSGKDDGWAWETSREWEVAAEGLKRDKEQWMREQRERERAAGWGYDPEEEAEWNRGGGNPNGLIQYAGGQKNNTQGQKQSKAERILGRLPGSYSDVEEVPMKTLKSKKVRPPEEFVISEDEEEELLEVEEARLNGDANANGDINGRRSADGDWASWNE